MSQHKQMKAVSPLLQQVINISSIVGGVGCFTVKGNPIRLYSASWALGATTLYLFTNPTNCCSDYSGSFDLSGWGLYLRPHHRNYL